jgi:quercetin dioxygenase-like cupin family protein
VAHVFNFYEIPGTVALDGTLRAATIPTGESVTITRGTAAAGWKSTPHAHAFDQWLMVLLGAATLTLNGKDIIALRPGSVALIPKGTMHVLHVLKGEGNEHGYEHIEFGLGIETRDPFAKSAAAS